MATHTGLCGFPQASQLAASGPGGCGRPTAATPRAALPSACVAPASCPPPAPRPPYEAPRCPSHPRSHYREAVRQTVKGLGFGVTVIRGCGPFVHGVNLGKWLQLPGPWFSHLHDGVLRNPSSRRGRQEGVTQPSTAPGASYQIMAGVLEDCACPARLGCPSFLWGIPSSTQV